MELISDQTTNRTRAANRMRWSRPTVATAVPNLRLIALAPEDAHAYYVLVDRNRRHLTQHGNYTDLGDATPKSVAASVSNSDGRNARFGVWLGGELIGRVDLDPRTPGDVVLGYWLGGEYTGKGYATAACRALIDYGQAELGAKTVYAGVTKGNAKSEALLGRLGFRVVEDRGKYTLFTLPLT
jgi:ribosomal-protein-serine acetyltransferase